MRKNIVAIILILILSFAASAVSLAQDDIPQVTITATVDGLTVPETVDEGLVTITFDNQSAAPILPVPVRLLENVTQTDFLATFEAEGQFAAIALIAMQGGTMIFPENQTTITYDLAAGEYALINFAADVPSFEWFMVNERDTDATFAEPEASVEVVLVDFAFGMPLEIEAGEQVWHIENLGGQWHEMMIMPVAEGTTIEEAQAMMLPAPVDGENAEADAPAEEEAAEEPPFAFMWIPVAEGGQAWLTVDLAPGTYAVGCMLPNMKEMGGDSEPHMHSDLGMVRIITVK